MTTAQQTMTTQEVADRLVAMCRKGQILESSED